MIVDRRNLSVNGRSTSIDTNTGLSAPEIHELLSTERRYLTVAYLKQRQTAEFNELVDWVTAQENDKDVSEISKKERKRVYATLKQSHLPKLKQAGAIAYDRVTGTIKAGACADAIYAYIPDAHATFISKIRKGLSASFSLL